MQAYLEPKLTLPNNTSERRCPIKENPHGHHRRKNNNTKMKKSRKSTDIIITYTTFRDKKVVLEKTVSTKQKQFATQLPDSNASKGIL